MRLHVVVIPFGLQQNLLWMVGRKYERMPKEPRSPRTISIGVLYSSLGIACIADNIVLCCCGEVLRHFQSVRKTQSKIDGWVHRNGWAGRGYRSRHNNGQQPTQQPEYLTAALEHKQQTTTMCLHACRSLPICPTDSGPKSRDHHLARVRHYCTVFLHPAYKCWGRQREILSSCIISSRTHFSPAARLIWRLWRLIVAPCMRRLSRIWRSLPCKTRLRAADGAAVLDEWPPRELSRWNYALPNRSSMSKAFKIFWPASLWLPYLLAGKAMQHASN